MFKHKKQWEYAVLLISPLDQNTLEKLDRYGSVGYELVSVVVYDHPQYGQIHEYTFKREL